MARNRVPPFDPQLSDDEVERYLLDNPRIPFATIIAIQKRIDFVKRSDTYTRLNQLLTLARRENNPAELERRRSPAI